MHLEKMDAEAANWWNPEEPSPCVPGAKVPIYRCRRGRKSSWDGQTLLRERLSLGKVAAQLWELIPECDTELRMGRECFPSFCRQQWGHLPFPLHPDAWRDSREPCWVWVWSGQPAARLTYLTVPGAELEGISRIGRIPATQIDPTRFETINPLISRVRISWPTTLMYFSLVLTAGERSPLALRGLFLSLLLSFLFFFFFGREAHWEHEELGTNKTWWKQSSRAAVYLIQSFCAAPLRVSYAAASRKNIVLLHNSCTDCSSHKSRSILVALEDVTSGSWFVWGKSQMCLQQGMEIIGALYRSCHSYLTSQGLLVNYIRSAFVISGWCSWWRLEMMCLLH